MNPRPFFGGGKQKAIMAVGNKFWNSASIASNYRQAQRESLNNDTWRILCPKGGNAQNIVIYHVIAYFFLFDLSYNMTPGQSCAFLSQKFLFFAASDNGERKIVFFCKNLANIDKKMNAFRMMKSLPTKRILSLSLSCRGLLGGA
jgi:hypothetical protein